MKLKALDRDRPEPYLAWLAGLSPQAEYIARIHLCERVPSCSRQEFVLWAEAVADFDRFKRSPPYAIEELQRRFEECCALNAAVAWRMRRALAPEYEEIGGRSDGD